MVKIVNNRMFKIGYIVLIEYKMLKYVRGVKSLVINVESCKYNKNTAKVFPQW